MKTLPDGRIQVESGDTLSGIYGSNWKELSGYTGDPTKLQIGTVLPAKSSGSLGGSLTPETSEKTLPNQPVDKLSMFGDVLKMVTQRAAKESISKGGKALPKGMLDPSQVSGGTFANILNFTKEQKTRGIADIYQSTLNMISESRSRADKQLTMLINTGAIADLDEDSIKGLADLTDYPVDYIQAMKSAAIEESQDTTKMTDAGRINNLNTFFSDKVGKDTKISAQNYVEGFKRWIGLGGTPTDFKYSFPVEEWLGKNEWGNLPSEWQPKAQKTVPDLNTLPADEQMMINQVQSKINTYEVTYEQAIKDFPEYAIYFEPLKGY